MPTFPNLVISAWRVTRLDEKCYNISFDYSYTGGAGTCGAVPCASPDQLMDYTKMMANNDWPG